jgi:hypothetical protein
MLHLILIHKLLSHLNSVRQVTQILVFEIYKTNAAMLSGIGFFFGTAFLSFDVFGARTPNMHYRQILKFLKHKYHSPSLKLPLALQFLEAMAHQILV